MQEQSVNEQSLLLRDSNLVDQQLIISCIIYSAEYYPFANHWLSQIIDKCLQKPQTQQSLMNSIQKLISDLTRELLYGPTATYITAHDRPHYQHLNCNLIRKSNPYIYQLKVEEVRNSVGSLCLHQLVQDEQIGQLVWYRRSYFMKLGKFIKKQISKQIRKQLEVNGQSWSESNPLPTLLLTLLTILRKVKLSKSHPALKSCLLLARLSFLHNKILQNPAKQLADEVLSNYREYITQMNHSKTIDVISYTQVMLEYAQVLVFYYKYSQCQRILEFCKQITNIDLQFSGRLGRRTKFQTFDIPQLVMNIKEKEQKVKIKSEEDNQIDKQAIDLPNAKQLILKQIQETKVNHKTQIDTSNFDEQNILLERPKFVEGVEEKENIQKVDTHQILVILAAIQYMWDTSPKEDILYQYISTSLQTLLQYKQHSYSYPIIFNILLLRSLNEFPRTKNVERALDQLQKIKNNYNEKTQKDVQFIYSTAYLTHCQFIKILAQKYMEIGMTMTAIELYEKVGMFEECMDGLVAKNFKQKALSLANKYQKQHGVTPRVLCILGDLQEGDKCLQYYNQAWQLSEKRCARAQRSIGWHYYPKKQYDKAAQAFKKATQANFYHPNTWFTLGCCYLQLKQYQKGVSAFGECVCIDDSQGEAWGNIATCYIYQKRFKQAYSALEQALKNSQRNWKLWSNMMSVSLKLRKFYKYFQCVEQLITQQKSQILNTQILSKLVIIFKHQQETSERRRPIQVMKNRLDRLYTFLTQKIGQSTILWHSIYEYNTELQHYITKNQQHYQQLVETSQLDINDLIDGYETMEQIKNTTCKQLAQIKQNILDSKQKELNMAMKIGWEFNKKVAEEVAIIFKEYIAVFQKYCDFNNQKSLAEFKLFVSGVRKKLEHCLEGSIDLKSTIL